MAGVLVTLLLVAAAVVGLALVAFSAYLGRALRGMLDAITDGRFDLREPSGPPTPEAAARTSAAERLGFELVLDRELVLAGDEQRLLLFWRADGTMVEVSQRASGDGRANRLARAEEAGRVFGDEGSIIDAPTTVAKVAALRAAGAARPWD